MTYIKLWYISLIYHSYLASTRLQHSQGAVGLAELRARGTVNGAANINATVGNSYILQGQ